MAKLNPIITNLLNELNIEEYEKKYILSALDLEYENSDKDRPQLKSEYFDLIEEAYDSKNKKSKS